MNAAPTSISIVVPTRDRPERIGACLRALATQTVAAEVIVVDDGSERPAAVAAAVAGAPGGARLIRTGPGGPARARNRGVEAAGGELVCFTDDDCEPEPGWAGALSAAAARSGGGTAAGPLLTPEGAGASVRASQAVIDALQLGTGRRPGEQLEFTPTANLACSQAALAEVRFDESFPLAAGEDREFCRRLAAAGRSPAFAPEAVVVHRQQEGLRALVERQYRYGRGAVQLRRRSPGSRPAGAGYYRALLGRGLAQGAATLPLLGLGLAATAAGVARESAARN